MKRFAIIVASIFLTIALVAPAMAATLEIGGHSRVRGFYKSNNDSALTKEAMSDAYYDMRFRPEITFKVNDNVYVNSRVAVFDEKFGTKSSQQDLYQSTYSDAGKGDSAAWDRGWMTIKTANFGRFDIGRMTGGLFGLDLFDSEKTADRIKWSNVYDLGDAGKIKVLALTEKYGEDANNDANASRNTVEGDMDGYALAGIYYGNNFETGLLIQYNVREEDSTTARTNYFIPYFKGQFDNIGVRAEIKMASGTTENKANSASDVDTSGLGYYFAVDAAFGPATVELGYASASGDDPNTANETESLGGLGTEWTPFVILQDANAILGDYTTNGVNLLYAQADYKLSDDITLTGVLGMANANEKNGDGLGATRTDDDFGMELDAKLAWKLMDGVTYNFNLGYLSAGDFFKGTAATATDPENTYTAFHTVQVDF